MRKGTILFYLIIALLIYTDLAWGTPKWVFFYAIGFALIGTAIMDKLDDLLEELKKRRNGQGYSS